MANLMYNTAKLRLWHGAAGVIDLLVDDIIVIALETDDDPDDPDEEFVAGVLGIGDAVEVTSTGYVGGFGGADRISLTTPTITVDQANDRAEFDCDNVVWSAIDQAAAEVWTAILVARELTSDALSPVIGKIDTATGLPLTPNGSDITLTIDAEGLFHVT